MTHCPCVARVALAAGIFAFSWASPSFSEEKTFGIGTNPPSTFAHSAGSAVAAVASREGNMRMAAIAFGGSSVFLPGVSSGDPEFGVANELEALYAVRGEGTFGKANPNIRVVGVLTPLYSSVFVEANSAIQSLKDLRGKAFGAGFTSQTIARPMIQGILANGGLDSARDIRPVLATNMARAADDFAQQKTDAFYFAMGAGKVLEIGSKIVGGLRALSVDTSPEALDALRRFVPVAYPVLLTPKDALYGVKKPTYVMSFDYLVLVYAGVSDDVVYRVTKALHDNPEKVTVTFPSLRFVPRKMYKPGTLEYHAGALMFYRERNIVPSNAN